MLRDPAALLTSVRAGFQVVIDGKHSPIAVLAPPSISMEEPEPGYDEWFRAQVLEAMDDDPANDLSAAEVEKHFADRRAASLLKLNGIKK
jgi:antitoxin (DNA-binding transcriptional repressor) of toxin-antitoxin stability system